MGPPRKRSSSRISKGVQATQKKLRSNTFSVTSNPTAPGGGYIEQKILYTVPCKREDRGVKEEPEGGLYDPNRIKGEPSDWTKDSEVQGNSLGKYSKIKDEQEEGDFSQITSQEVKPQEPLQKWMLKDKKGSQNFPTNTEDIKVKPFTCFCGKSYTCTSHLNRHRKSHGSEVQFPAVQNNSPIIEEKTIQRCFSCQCGKQYTRRSNLKRHQNRCNEQALVETPDTTVTYRNVEDQEEKFKPYVCACGKSYTSSSHLYRHQRSHVEPDSQGESRYICDCGKTYSCSSHLYRHQRTHAEEKPPLEDVVIEDSETLEKRLKPYMCFCGKRYTCSSHLYRHQKVHRVENLPLKENKGVKDNEMEINEKRYKCDCGKSYSSPSHLYRHQRTHKEPDVTTESNDLDHDSEVDLDDCREKPYKCECGKSFILSFSLLLHKKIHCRWKQTSDSPGD